MGLGIGWREIALVLGIFAVVGWAVVIPLFFQAVRLQWKAGDELAGKVCSTFLTYEIVESELQRRAKMFDTLCKHQIQLQGIENAQNELQDLARRLEGAKSDFWTAHALAGQVGYGTRERLKSYLLPQVPSID